MKTAGLLAALTMMVAGQVPAAAHGSKRVRGDLMPQFGGSPRLKHVRAETYPGQHTAHLVGAWRGDGTPGPVTRQQRRAKGERWGMQGATGAEKTAVDSVERFCGHQLTNDRSFMGHLLQISCAKPISRYPPPRNIRYVRRF